MSQNQAPTQIPDPQQPTSQYAYNAQGAVDRGTIYKCGDCDLTNVVRRGDPVRCKDCGYRVIYKERTNRIVQFEAR